MKILLIGPTDSIWMKAYIENVLLNHDFEIMIIGKQNNRFINFYLDNNIQIIDSDKCKSKIGLIKKISRYIYPLITLLKDKQIDILHVEYANHYALTMASILSKRVKKIIVSYWGSDLFRASKNELKKRAKYLGRVDIITLCTKSMKEYFELQYGDIYTNKLQIIDYGANGFAAIDRAIELKTSIPSFNFPKNKIVVMVGYNGSIGQQHIKVIKVLKNLSINLQKKLFIVFPMTYATNKKYLSEIKKELQSDCGFEFCILEDYLSPEQMAQLYINSDWMIHAQITDALSASVQEFLYSGKLIFNPEWLNYEEIDSRGVYYIKYKNFSELENLLIKYINKGLLNEEKKKLKNNRDLLYEYSSWNVLKNKWLKLYL